jgi:membrane protease YdiL (CAAX protease family)
MDQLSKAQSLLLVADAFLVTQVFTWWLIYHAPQTLWFMFPDLPASLPVLTGSMAMLLGSACLSLLANQTLVTFKFDLPAVLALGIGLIANWMLITFQRPLFAGSGQLNFAEWDLDSAYLYLFVMIGFGPVVEEILVRGGYFEVLRRSWGDKPALKISTMLFVIPHLIWSPTHRHLFSVVSLTLSSLLYTFLYIIGGLVPAIIVHAAMNFYINLFS